MIRVTIIPTDRIDLYWDQAKSWLNEPIAMSRGRFTQESVYRGLVGGGMQLWLAHENGPIIAAAVTSLEEYPSGATWCSILLLGGQNISSWINIGMAAIEDWAILHHCRGVQPAGREGFEKFLAPLGYVPLARAWQKDLSNA